jgi:hypothetical protein
MSSEKNNLEPYEGYKETQIEVAAIQTKKVRNAMFSIAVVLLVHDFLSLAMVNKFEPVLVISSFIFPILFVGIGLLALKQPNFAVIAAVIVFAFLLILQIVVSGGIGAISGILVKAIIVYLIFAGYQSSREVQKAKKEIELL